jgi:hypothetical protein
MSDSIAMGLVVSERCRERVEDGESRKRWGEGRGTRKVSYASEDREGRGTHAVELHDTLHTSSNTAERERGEVSFIIS